MKTLAIQVPDDVADRAQEAAHEKGVSLEDLVRTSLEEKLARDREFDRAAGHVLAKNAELYERLA